MALAGLAPLVLAPEASAAFLKVVLFFYCDSEKMQCKKFRMPYAADPLKDPDWTFWK